MAIFRFIFYEKAELMDIFFLNNLELLEFVPLVETEGSDNILAFHNTFASVTFMKT